MSNILDMIRKKQQEVARETVLTPPAPETAQVSDAPPTLVGNRLKTLSAASERNVKAEVERICRIPISYMPDAETIKKVSEYYCPDGSFGELWPEQVKALIEFHNVKGLMAPISVGGGKTLICVLIANDCYRLYKKQRILHLCPSNLVGQLERKLKEEYQAPFNISVPYHFLALDKDKNRRMLRAKSGRAGVYVLSYHLLSGKEGAELIEAIKPEVVIGDEIQEVTSDKLSARGRRFKETRNNYDSWLCGLSGTITKKKPIEYHYLAVNSLRDCCFMPRTETQAADWSKVIDSDAGSWDAFSNNNIPHTGPLAPLINWSNENFNTMLKYDLMGFRTAYKQRMITCPGVVCSSENDSERIGSTLVIKNHTIEKSTIENSKGYNKLKELLSDLLDAYIAPNGDEIEHPFTIWRWRYELESFGCYNDTYWPTVDKVAERRSISKVDASYLLELSKEHHALLQAYHKELRDWLKYNGRRGLDTPALVGANMARYGGRDVGVDLYAYWSAAKAVWREDLVERDKRFVRVCDFRINEVLRWALEYKKSKEYKKEGAIIWYRNIGVGNWIAETLRKADLPVVHCSGGADKSVLIEDKKYKDCFCVASIAAHHKGHDSPHFATEYFAQFPREAYIAEQCLGRFHRAGQYRDMVYAHTSFSLDFDWAVFSACLNDAAYLHQTQPAKQKLIYATYTEKPKQIPYAVLKEWGAKGLHVETKEMKKIIEKVG